MNRLASALVALSVLLWPVVGPGHAADQRGVLSAPEAQQSIEQGDLTMIDIRHPREWQDTGVATSALPISMHDPKGPNAFLAAVLAAVNGNKARPVALICASGVRSTWASRFLKAQGFQRVYNVKEGMLGAGSEPGWIRRGLPVRSYPF